MKNRTIEIIKKLLVSEHPISLKKMAEDFSVSQRTIRNKINEINDYLNILKLPIVEHKQKRGYLLDLTSSQKKYLEKELFNPENLYLNHDERSLDILLDLCFSVNPIFLNKKEEKFKISKSTMDEDMRKLRQQVIKYGIEIVSIGKKGLNLSGPERSIRTMIFDIINKTVGIIDLYEVNK
ncbi:MAG: helix-turn-helix domain-containing protein, partial [Enterococcus sp.]